MTRFKIAKTLLAAGAAATLTTPLLAQVDARRLQGERTSDAVQTLRDLGYSESRKHSEGGNDWVYYHNKNASQPCIGIASRGGRVTASSGFAESECHHGNDAGAAVAGVAVAALLGAALLGHHDKHHKDGKHHSNQQHEADYERGYRDGMHNGQFINYDHSQYYSDGYAAGSRERENSLHSNRYHHHAKQRDSNHRADYASACAREAAQYWRLPMGSVTTYDVRSTGGGMHEVKVAAGYATGTCTVDSGGTVRGIMND